jgi:hypothetical protein
MSRFTKSLFSSFPLEMLLVGSISSLLSIQAGATTVVPSTFNEMTDQAELVFMGKVLGSRSEWRTTGKDRVIFTLVDFESQEVLKGNARKTVTLQFLGGTVGDATLEVAGMPKFEVGERVILFVEKNGINLSPLVGVFHGKFSIRADQQIGQDIVVTHEGKALRDVSEIGNGHGSALAPKRAKVLLPASQQPMQVEAFKLKILQRVASTSIQK